ncbi:MAG: hypothetical protein ER33_05040 [Cyanobium sp. CACIAM 14]|nr:MAG: hypothetical protein ER33_05040 [Cyanobium sp. CACIAM 14]
MEAARSVDARSTTRPAEQPAQAFPATASAPSSCALTSGTASAQPTSAHSCWSTSRSTSFSGISMKPFPQDLEASTETPAATSHSSVTSPVYL